MCSFLPDVGIVVHLFASRKAFPLLREQFHNLKSEWGKDRGNSCGEANHRVREEVRRVIHG
jgi:hypothetical protein